MRVKQKCIIHNCPAIYEYYPLDDKMQKCCYKNKDIAGEHHQCKDCNCILKNTITDYTFKKGTIQNKLNVEWIEDYEYTKSDKLKELWSEL